MQILLISANVATSPYLVYPLGMSIVAAAARAAGHTVHCFDFLQAGLSFDALAEAVGAAAPGVVGVSMRNIDNVNCVDEERYVDVVRRIVECVRQQCRAPIVLGGSAFSIMPESLLSAVGGDYGIVGEGERLFVEFLGRAQDGELPPPGAILRTDAYLHGADICGADYDADLLRAYTGEGSVASVQTKRGCSLHCVYCSYPSLEGRRVRPRRPDAVVDDIERLVKEHGISYIFFTDSVFNDDEGRYTAVLREMQKRGVKVAWSAFLKPSGLTAAAVDLMRETGLKAAEMGSDAACDTTLSGQRKPFRFKDIAAANDLLMGRDIAVAHYFMFGGPGETPATVREGIHNIGSLNCSAVFVFMGIRILPDTGLRDIAAREAQIAADQDLLVPVYYFAPTIDRGWLERTLDEAFVNMPHVVFPPGALDDKLQLLHKLGYAGSLWELLGPPSSRTATVTP